MAQNLITPLEVPGSGTTVVDRLKYLIQLSRKTQNQFSTLVGIDPSSVSKILTGRIPASDAFINRVVVNLGVSKEWLVHGKGVPFAKSDTNIAVIEGGEAELNYTPKGAPVYNVEATAGPTSLSRAFTEENIIGYLDMPGIDPRNPLVRVNGDSMVPTIPNGSYISIRAVNDTSLIYWGATYLVELEDYRMVKMVRRHEDATKLILHSANPAYDDIEVDRSQVVRLFLVENVFNFSTLA